MEKTTTLFKKCFRLAKTSLYGLFALSLSFLSVGEAAAQVTYCNATSNYDCQNYNMYIGGIEILSGNNTIFYKSDDGCNQATTPNYTLMSTTPSFTLVSGGEYTFKVNTGNNYNVYIGVWVDLDGDGNFSNSEWLSSGWGQVSYGGSVSTFTFELPCNNLQGGVTRMRVRSDYYGVGLYANNGCGSIYYGETEDYTIEVKSPSSITADFFIPDTAYVGTIVNLVNGTSGAFVNNWDIGANGTVNYTTEHAQHIFNSTGTYSVKLQVENCAGKDSITKDIVIVNPTAPPVADFVSTKNQLGLNEEFTLVDLSTNGPTYWSWSLIKGFDTIYIQGANPYIHKNPSVLTGDNPVGFPKIFPDIGLWDVCLVASNVVGSSAVKCKSQYIEVVQTVFRMDAGLRDAVVGAATGTLTDDGGPINNYTTSGTYIFSTIAPCGAKSVTLEFQQWKVLSNANLKVYDGLNALGTPLHSGTGFTSSNPPTGALKANSGAMYLIWETTSGTSDSGFIATWTSEAGTGDPPLADFDLPNGSSTLYNAVTYDFINTSQNAEGTATFEWRVDGSVVGLKRDLENQVFYQNKTYTIQLTVLGCDGSTSKKTKTFTVAHPGTPTELDFTVSNKRPAPGEVVTFTATSDKANRWEWTFFPGNGVTPEGTVSDLLNEREFSFSKPGKYTVQCKAYNSIDSSASANTVIKANFVVVINPCTPIVSVTTSTDVANSRFTLEDVNTGEVLIDNPSDVGVAYEDFEGDLGVINLNYGATYEFTMMRTSNTNPMTRKIWIDWNVDGDFDDAGEEVGSQASGTSMSWTNTFTVPDVNGALDATTKLRLGVSYGTDPNHPCGAAGAPNANRIGEFEDYSVRVVNDGDIPVITLIGNDTVYVEQATSGPGYMDEGATAWDPSQGDITSSLMSNSNVDLSLTGIYEVVYTVSDASGNEAVPKTRYVFVVVDQTPPVITLNGVQHDTIEVGSNWADAGASAIDNKSGNLDNAIIVTGSVDPFTLGTYEITYTVKDAQGNETTVIRTITVVDTQAPIISNASAVDVGGGIWEVQTQLSSVFVDVTAVSDNYNSIGNGLDFMASPGNGAEAIVDTRFKGSTMVTYTAMDESGNTTVQMIRYVVEDYQPPVIDLHTLDTVYHDVNTPYSPVNATASDNLYGSTEISLSKTSNVNPFALGVYQDTYTATDASGNVATRIRYVKVVDREAPVISGKNGPILRVGLYSEFAAIERISFSDNYWSPASLKANTVVTYTDINTYKEGMYSAVFVTTDGSGNVSEPYTLYIIVSRAELPLGVDDLDVDNVLTVSPNPTSGLLTINVDLPENEEITVEVYNNMGQKVQDVVSGSIANGNYQVDLSNSGQGIYYVRMTVRGTVVTKKVVVQY